MESMGISDITFDSRIVRCSSAGHKFDAKLSIMEVLADRISEARQRIEKRLKSRNPRKFIAAAIVEAGPNKR